MIRTLILLSLTISLLATNTFSEKALTVFHLGNSLTDETYGVHDIAAGFGYTDIQWGRFMVPGAPLHLLWSDCQKGMPDDWGFRRGINANETYSFTGTPDQYLKRTAVDVVVLQLFPLNGDAGSGGTVTAAVGFAGCAYQSNPNCQVYIFASHTMNYQTKDTISIYTTIYEPVMQAVRNAYPSRKPALIIPTNLAWNKMYDEGFTNLWISPSDGHANDNGRYLNYVLLYSIIYKRDCAGARTTEFTFGNIKTTLSSSFISKAQSVAWDIASTYTYAGIAPTSTMFTFPESAFPFKHDFAGTADRKVYDLQGKKVSATYSNKQGTAVRTVVVHSKAESHITIQK